MNVKAGKLGVVRCSAEIVAPEAGTDFSGVPVGARGLERRSADLRDQGVKALEDFLSTEGVKNINAVNAALKAATPWFKKLGVAAGV